MSSSEGHGLERPHDRFRRGYEFSDEPGDPSPEPHPNRPADPWSQSTRDPWVDVTPGAPVPEPAAAPPTRGRRSIAGIGLFAAGAVAGALVTGLYTGWGSNGSNTALAAQNGQAQSAQPGAPGQQGQGLQAQQGQGSQGLGVPDFGYGQGPRGEQRVVGTLTAVSSSKITVKSGTASATYTIASDTQIMRNGALVTAADLRVGDQVLVHVFPAANSDGVLERIIARSGSTPGRSSTGTSSSDVGSTT